MLVSDSMREPLDCLSGVVQCCLVRPEVYGMMEKVVENMVMSHSAPMQTTCKNLLVDFLLTYPMTTESVEHFIHFLVKNLSYEESSGRLLVVQALRLILQRFDP